MTTPKLFPSAAAFTLAAFALVGCTTPDPTLKTAAVEAPAAPPELASLSPAEGSLIGGETVTLTGANLEDVTEVTFGDQPATDVTVVDSTTVTAVVPHSIDYVSGASVDVEIATAAGTAGVESAYTYLTLTAVDRQLEYAFAHWDDYNLAAYGDFTTWGGDCINFVSQTLVARGWTTTDEWFNDAQENWAPAFVHVPSFDDLLATSSQYDAVKLTHDQQDQAKIGDVVVFDWDGDGSLDHAQVISGVEGDTIYMVGHDMNSTYRSIDLALEQQGTPAATVAFWSIPTA